MDTKTILKYVMIGGAVYLVYRYFFASPAVVQAAGTGAPPLQPPAGTQPKPPTGIQLPPAPVPPPPPLPVAATPTYNWPTGDALLVLLATDEGAARAYPKSVTMNLDEWNFYRAQGGKPVPDALLVPGINDANRSVIVFTPSGYWDAIKPLGMSGLYGLGTVAPQYRWLM
jgi:hypothetical protein